jgi:glyoxylase-like metal-dependent hydrolase (beta-lactamase superfamily II)
MAPDTYASVGDMTAVVQQPQTDEQRRAAFQALLSCPTYSIHCTDKANGEQAAAARSMPTPVQGCPNVYHCGWHQEASYAATSYLIVRPEGNIMVDTPRFVPQLADRILVLGGIKYIFLTHQDDVAGHDKWAEWSGAKRIIHTTEANRQQGTIDCEIKLEGTGPWQLPDGSEDIDILHVPGHTRGSCAMLYKPAQTLFSGDHLSYSAWRGRLNVSRAYNWYDFDEQLHSVAKLLDYDFLHLLPGHGRRAHFSDATDRLKKITEVLEAEGYTLA